MGPLTVPCGQPPWGQLAAVDLTTNKIVWRHPVGTARDSGPFKWKLPIPLPIGAMNFGGTMATGSGLVFMGATMDNYIRAFDVRNGRELWRARLPAGGQAMPMTYMAGGKQYVVITAGGHGRIGTTVGDYTIAYTLPDVK
jgi:quinoprotein glucose dehydrogenase